MDMLSHPAARCLETLGWQKLSPTEMMGSPAASDPPGTSGWQNMVEAHRRGQAGHRSTPLGNIRPSGSFSSTFKPHKYPQG